jgi:hypothetical protein
MKNLFVLPTPNPSRLVKFFTNKFHLCKEILPIHDEEEYQNIYITDNSEIKKGDWIVIKNIELNRVSTIKCETENQVLIANSKSDYNIKKKIILTTDQDLIADGIQAIDDEFLEWFVKNPSCEKVEVYKDKRLEIEQDFHFYEIIIPKEEPKKDVNWKSDIINKIWDEDEEPKQGTMSEAIKQVIDNQLKQETLEEVMILNGYSDKESDDLWREGVKFGVEWQQEQIGKSEFLQKLRATLSDAEARRLIFETFKEK